MGFSTDFTGAVSVTPPLNAAEIEYLRLFAATRHVDDRPEGDYYVDGMSVGTKVAGPGLPGLWCGWIAIPDGSGIQWDGSDKFYDSYYWMQWIIDHLLRPGAHAQGITGFEGFTFDHHVNGSLDAVSEGIDGNYEWELDVDDNTVLILGKTVYELDV